MDFQRYIRTLAKRWRIVVACMLLGILSAAAVNILTPKTYSSSIRFFVSTVDAATTAQLAQGGAFSQDRVKSYTELMKTPKVLAPVAEELGIPGGASALAGKISARAATGTVMIETSVVDQNPERATAIAATLGREFPKFIEALEAQPGTRKSPVKVTLVQEATPAQPVSPRWVVNLALGVLLGTISGLALALLRDRLDTKIRSKADLLEADDSLPVLGAIPFSKEAPAHPLAMEFDPLSRRAEAYRALRTNLQFVDVSGDSKVLTITSSIPGEGKSTTSANIALAIAESGASVCLIEGDLRKPRLLSYMGLEGGVGLTDALIGRVEVREVAQQFTEKPLRVLGAGATPPNPSVLLGSEAMKTLLTDLRERFDYVIIDAPPLLPVTDAAVLSRVSDGALLIVGAGVVKREQVLEALDTLDAVGATVLGVILNRVEQDARGGYYEYGVEQSERTDPPKARARRSRGTA